jgi:plastocyanin
MRKLPLLALAAALFAALIVPSGAMGASTAKVGLYDDFFSKPGRTTACPQDATCAKYKVKTKFKFTWKGVNPHNLVLFKAPKGIDKEKYSHPDPEGQGFVFSRRLKKPGKWYWECQIHPGMEIRVKIRS